MGEHKRTVRGFVERVVAEARFRNRDAVASRLMLLIEGAIVTAYVEGDHGPAGEGDGAVLAGARSLGVSRAQPSAPGMPA